MRANKKIAILIPDLCGGGAERVSVNLANEFDARGFSVDLVVLKKQGVYLQDVSSTVRIIDLNASRIRNSLIPLAKYMQNEKPAAMIANMWPLTGFAKIAQIISRAKLTMLVVEHTNWLAVKGRNSSIGNMAMRIGMKLLYPRVDHVIAVSKGAAADLALIANMPSTKVKAIHNPIVGINKKQMEDNFDTSKWLDPVAKRIIAIGAMKHEKDYSLLLEAFSIVKKSVNVRLLILGDGGLRSKLQSLVNQLDIDDSVLMPGFSTSPNLHLVNADLFVLSSNAEGFGNVIVEALNAGVPVVSTDCPSGPREILEDGKYGILTPVGDAEALASAMLKSLSSTHDKEALKARAQDFTIAKASDKYLALLFPEIDMV